MHSCVRVGCGVPVLLSAALALSGCYVSSESDAVEDAGCAAVADSAPPPESNGTGSPNSVSLPRDFKLDSLFTLSVPASGSWRQPSSYESDLGGSIRVVSPLYSFNLSSAQLTVYGSSGNASSMFGNAMVNMPALHTFSGLGLKSPVFGFFGYQLGSYPTLANLGMPLDRSRKYLYFSFQQGASSSFGTGAFSMNAGSQTSVIVDPRDPAVYFSGSMGPLTAIALSEQALIPFQAQTTFGFDTPGEDFPTFTGHSYMAGEVSLEEIPVTVSGAVTTKFVNWDGKKSLDKTLYDHTLGVNGSFNIGWDFLDGLFRLEAPLAKASLYLASTGKPYRATAAVSGTAGTATFLPSWMPVVLGANSSVAGYMDTADSSKNHIDGATDITIKASTLGSQIGFPMNDLPLSKGTYHVDKMGFRYNGVASTGLTPQLVSASAYITACFGGDTVACLSDDQSGTPVMGSKDWLIRMEGDVVIASVPLASATALASAKGLTVSAYLKTQAQQVTMTGYVTAGPHVQLTGSAQVEIPLTGTNEFLTAIVSGAQCGYQKVTDAAKCGVDALDFGDEFHCGKPHCSWSWKHGLRCSHLSCSVKVPKTCNDLSKPNTCVPGGVPQINLGKVSGAVALTISDSGITSGKLSGSYCAAGGGCSSVSGIGQVDLDNISSPRICVTSSEISSALPSGKFCVHF